MAMKEARSRTSSLKRRYMEMSTAEDITVPTMHSTALLLQSSHPTATDVTTAKQQYVQPAAVAMDGQDEPTEAASTTSINEDTMLPHEEAMKFVADFKQKSALEDQKMSWIVCLKEGQERNLFNYKTSESLCQPYNKYNKYTQMSPVQKYSKIMDLATFVTCTPLT